MGQPQNPPDPTQSDAQAALTDPDQNAIDSALNAYQQASANFNYWQQKVADYQNDPNAAAADQSSASQQADSARTQLAAASRDYSNLLNQVAHQRQMAAQAAKDPNEQRLWANEADRAQSQSDLYKAESSLYSAKTDADIAKAQTDSQAAMSRATSVANRVQSQNDASQAQALLANAKAAQIPALTQSTVDLHNSTIQRNSAYVQYLNSRTTLSNSQANLANARAQLISGPQAQSLLSKAELDAAKAKGLDLTQGATLDKIQSAANLSDARVAQIAANISKSQVLPYNDKTNPTLTVFQPSTGNVTGVPNPGYVNTTLQGINDTDAAISQIQNEISQGTMTPDEGTALISNLRQALQYKALGVTPDQYLQAQNQQAQLGQNLLTGYGNMLDKGQTAASEFLNAAKGVRGFHGQVTPFSTFGQIAQQTYGPLLDKAKQLISQVQPVHDQFSALQAMSQLSQARNLVAQHIQQQGGQPPASPTDQNATANATPGAAGPDNTATPVPPNPTTAVTPEQAAAAGLGAQP